MHIPNLTSLHTNITYQNERMYGCMIYNILIYEAGTACARMIAPPRRPSWGPICLQRLSFLLIASWLGNERMPRSSAAMASCTLLSRQWASNETEPAANVYSSQILETVVETNVVSIYEEQEHPLKGFPAIAVSFPPSGHPNHRHCGRFPSIGCATASPWPSSALV